MSRVEANMYCFQLFGTVTHLAISALMEIPRDDDPHVRRSPGESVRPLGWGDPQNQQDLTWVLQAEVRQQVADVQGSYYS